MSQTQTAKQIEKLEKRQAQLQAQIQNLKARDRSKQEREDTRRKILVGAYILDQTREKNTYATLVAQLDGYLTRDSDRKLFELPQKKEIATREIADAIV
jgi:hypothetical protein